MMKPLWSLALILALVLGAPSGAAAAKAPEEKPVARPKALRVAVMPLINRTQEPLADQVVSQVLKEQLAEFDVKRASILLVADVERILGAHDAFHHAYRLAERWALAGTPDSAAIAAIDTVLDVDALLCVKIAEWDVKRINVINAGQSSTTIGLEFALFDIHTGKLLWRKTQREERFAEEVDIMSGSVTYDETGTFQSRRTNEPPRPKDVAENLVKLAFKKFPQS